MRINLMCIGKTDAKEIKHIIDYYILRLPKHWNFQLIEIPDIKNSGKFTPELIKKEEAKIFFQHIEPNDYIILLDEKGKLLTSREFAGKLNDFMGLSIKKIHFLIGGAYGFSNEIYQRANEKISLSKMTFTHQMVRLFIIEQLYRADQILQGKPYHND